MFVSIPRIKGTFIQKWEQQHLSVYCLSRQSQEIIQDRGGKNETMQLFAKVNIEDLTIASEPRVLFETISECCTFNVQTLLKD